MRGRGLDVTVHVVCESDVIVVGAVSAAGARVVAGLCDVACECVNAVVISCCFMSGCEARRDVTARVLDVSASRMLDAAGYT